MIHKSVSRICLRPGPGRCFDALFHDCPLFPASAPLLYHGILHKTLQKGTEFGTTTTDLYSEALPELLTSFTDMHSTRRNAVITIWTMRKLPETDFCEQQQRASTLIRMLSAIRQRIFRNSNVVSEYWTNRLPTIISKLHVPCPFQSTPRAKEVSGKVANFPQDAVALASKSSSVSCSPDKTKTL